MIFVTVGTHHQGFDRLVRVADAFAGASPEEVIIQRGSSSYLPVHAKSFPFADNATMRKYICDAGLVISHAGAGTIIEVLSLGKPLLLVPRLKVFGENRNDHQLQLANELARQGCVRVVVSLSVDTLACEIAGRRGIAIRVSGREMLLQALETQLQAWCSSPHGSGSAK